MAESRLASASHPRAFSGVRTCEAGTPAMTRSRSRFEAAELYRQRACRAQPAHGRDPLSTTPKNPVDVEHVARDVVGRAARRGTPRRRRSRPARPSARPACARATQAENSAIGDERRVHLGLEESRRDAVRPARRAAPSSTASARVSILSPPLLTAYGTMLGRPMSEASEQMLMILPRRRAFIAGHAARASRGTDRRGSPPCSARHSSSANSSSGLRLIHRRVVDEDVDRAERALDIRDAVGDRGCIGDVERRRAGVEDPRVASDAGATVELVAVAAVQTTRAPAPAPSRARSRKPSPTRLPVTSARVP